MRISDWSSDVCSSDLRICRRYRFGALARDDADRDHAVFGDDEGLPFRQGPDLLHALRSEYRGIDLRRVAAEFDPHLRQARSDGVRSEEHTSELQSLMRISYAVFCLKKKKINHK